MKRHNGIKEYKCKYCLKDYIQKSHLVNHIEKFHKKAFEDDDNIYGLSLWIKASPLSKSSTRVQKRIP